MFKMLTAATLLLAALAAGTAHAWEIQLTVSPVEGPDGPRPVTIGVPLLAGQAKEISELRLVARGGQGSLGPVPAQFRVLARWWRADSSIRWVLVDYVAMVKDKEVRPVFLTNAAVQAPAPKQAVAVEQTADAITVTTGPARFVLNRRKFNFLDRVALDADGDGRFDDAENLLAAAGGDGIVVEDTYGQEYFGADGTASVEVVESGPLRVCVRARGRNLARGGQGYEPGMYGYDVFLNFYAGSADVYADVVLTNNPPKSIGSPTFEDASLLLKLAGPATGYRLVGEKPAEGTLARGESVCLYQDSNGADTWEACPGPGHMHTNGWTYPKGTITSFRGFRLLKRTTDAARAATQPAEAGEVIGQGDHARGLAQLTAARGGVIVHTKHFWQQFPKAVELAADGTVRLGLFPRECKVVHFLEDTSAKGHEIVLHFFTAADAGRQNAEAVADAWDHRLTPRPPVEHIAAAGALADLGPFTPPTIGLDATPGSKVAIDSSRMLTDDRLYGNAYGWQIYGERWRSNGGHGSRGARQPIDEDNYLWRWYVTGVPAWFAVGDARSRQFRDVRCFRIDGQDAFGFADWKAFRAANRNEDWTNRPQPKGDEYTKYTQGIWSRSPWLFPNPEHTTLDLLYDRYLLTGDQRSLEDMRIAAAHGGYFSGRGGAALSGGWPWRANGWGWRALLRYWDLTGDAEAAACLQDVIKTHAAYIGKAPLVSYNDVKKDEINWWFTGIYCRAAAMAALWTGDPRALALCKTLAEGKEKDAKRVPTLFAVLYHLTGEQAYRTAVLGDGDGADLLRVGGYFPACDHWLLHQPPQPMIRH